MHKILLLLAICFLVGCGTAMKVQQNGPIEMGRQVDGVEQVPVLLQYKFKIPSDQHELFFWDENKNRFNIKVAKEEDTAHGIVIYLPAGRLYALSGFLTVKSIGRTEYSFGESLNLFKLKPGVVNALPYFEVTEMPGGKFYVAQDPQSHIADAAKKFGSLKDVRQIPVKLIDRVTR